MFNDKAIKELKAQITELSEKVDRLAEKQNSHFTELMFTIRGTMDAMGTDYSYDPNYVPSKDEDDMFEEAKRIVIESGKASTSFLQRKLRIGYARAARLMDILESEGVIAPGDGAKLREVLIKKEEA